MASDGDDYDSDGSNFVPPTPITLPYGNSKFFAVRKIDDPIGLFPEEVVIGVNERGLHFFRPVPKEYLHSVELRDIMHFGTHSSDTIVYFKMRVAKILHKFQFETKQGKEIWVALQTHINDAMFQHYSHTTVAPEHSRAPTVDANQKRVLELSKSLEVSENKVNQLKALCNEYDSALLEAMTEIKSLKGEVSKGACIIETMKD